MTRIGVVSDSHGSTLFLNAVCGALKDCDIVYHLGDCACDADILRNAGLKVTAVTGNCDHAVIEPYDRIDTKEGIRILLTHGHNHGVRYTRLRLKLFAEEEGCKIALYGHTHSAFSEFDDGILILNPGALSGGRYAEIVIDETGIHPSLKIITEI